jgi:hypothetical protein
MMLEFVTIGAALSCTAGLVLVAVLDHIQTPHRALAGFQIRNGRSTTRGLHV